MLKNNYEEFLCSLGYSGTYVRRSTESLEASFWKDEYKIALTIRCRDDSLNDDYKWDVNFCVELDNERNYKFEGSAFAFRYTMVFEVTDALKANTYFFEFNFDININIDTNGRPVLFLDNQSNTILEDEKLA